MGMSLADIRYALLNTPTGWTLFLKMLVCIGLLLSFPILGGIQGTEQADYWSSSGRQKSLPGFLGGVWMVLFGCFKLLPVCTQFALAHGSFSSGTKEYGRFNTFLLTLRENFSV